MGKDYRTSEYSAILKAHCLALSSYFLAKSQGLKELEISCRGDDLSDQPTRIENLD
jgi:hypothetical protein